MGAFSSVGFSDGASKTVPVVAVVDDLQVDDLRRRRNFTERPCEAFSGFVCVAVQSVCVCACVCV